MTHDHVAGFASELVKMAQAMERVPQLEAELRRQTDEAESRAETIEVLKVQLGAARTYAAKLEQSVRDAEASRDDAELRFLECDDAKDTLVWVLDGLGKNILGALQAVAPVETKPLHTPQVPVEATASVMEAICVDAPFVGQSEVDPTPSAITDTVSFTTTQQSVNAPIQSVEAPARVDTSTSVPEGISVPSDPTALTLASPTSPIAFTQTVTSEADACSSEGISVPSDPTSNASGHSVSAEDDASGQGNAMHVDVGQSEVDPTAPGMPSETGNAVASSGATHSKNVSAPATTDTSIVEADRPFVPTPTSPSASSSSADIGDTEHIQRDYLFATGVDF